MDMQTVDCPLLAWRPKLEPAPTRADGAMLIGGMWFDVVERASGVRFTEGFRQQWLLPYKTTVHAWDAEDL